MDEPLSNLDAKLRGQMRVEIARLYNQLDTTFIYVTHDQTEAMTLGTRRVVMKDGIVQQVDTPENLFWHPANKFVAGFIGTPPMNFTEMDVEADADGIHLNIKGKKVEIVEKTQRALSSGGYIGRTVDFGIRPEHMTIIPGHVDGAHAEGTVGVYEMLGSEAIAYVDLDRDEGRVIVKTDATLQLKVGDRVSLNFTAKYIHLFDHVTGETITN